LKQLNQIKSNLAKMVIKVVSNIW